MSSSKVFGKFIVFLVISMFMSMSRLFFGKNVVGNNLFLRNKIINKIKYSMFIMEGFVSVL